MSAPNIETSTNPAQTLCGGGSGNTPTVVKSYTTVNAPTATVGGIYFDSTFGNLMVGNAAGAWVKVVTG